MKLVVDTGLDFQQPNRPSTTAHLPTPVGDIPHGEKIPWLVNGSSLITCFCLPT